MIINGLATRGDFGIGDRSPARSGDGCPRNRSNEVTYGWRCCCRPSPRFHFAATVSSAQGWFTAAAAGASLMVGVYSALVFRPVVPRDLKTFDPKDRDQFVRRRRDISVVYLGSILLWFALLFWSGSQPEAKALYFSVETREHAIDAPCQFAVCSKEISSRLSYLDALYVAGGTFVTVGAAGITPLAPETRIWLLIEYVPLVVGALGLIRRDAP